MSQQSSILAVVYFLMATIMLNLSDVVVKLLPYWHLSINEGICYRSLASVLMMSPVLWGCRCRLWGGWRQFVVDFIRVGCLWLSIEAMYQSLQLTDLARVYAIGQLGPGITTLIATLVHGERLTRGNVYRLLVNLLGGLCIIGPDFLQTTDGVSWADGLSLLAVVMWSLYNNLQKMVSHDMPARHHLFTMNLFYLGLSVPWMMASGVERQLPLTIEAMMVCSVWGLWLLLASWLYSLALQYEKLSVLIPWEHSALIFAVLIGYLVFSEVVTASTLIGGFLIIMANVLYHRKDRLHQWSQLLNNGMKKKMQSQLSQG